MCSILLSYQTTDDWFWQIAANRDEHLERAALPPRVLVQTPKIVGGQDLQAGGTWFAVNPQRKMFAGLTNRHTGTVADWQGALSRGHLIPYILAADSACEAKQRLESTLSRQTVNHFMMLIGDPNDLFYADYDSGQLTVSALTPGYYILCNSPMTEEPTPKMKLIRGYVQHELAASPSAWIENAQRVLRHTELPTSFGEQTQLTPLDALNVQTQDYGTCSALIATCHVKEGMRYFATDGNPSDTPFRDMTKLLGEHSTDVN